MSPELARNWSVLILCTGYGNELLRSSVQEQVTALGFQVNVYDAPGYPVNPGVHSHTACLDAVNQHDIILAFAGQNQGGFFDYAQCPPADLEWLKENGVFDLAKDQLVPTIFQMEVLTARALKKPVLVFVPKDVESKVEQTIRTLRNGGLTLKLRRGMKSPRKLQTLIQRRAWSEIARFYNVPSGHIESFAHIAFLERLRRETPNFLSFYDPRDTANFKELIHSRLSGTALFFVHEHQEIVENQVEKKRNPVGEASLQDLLNDGLILDPPFVVVSGRGARRRLFRTSGRQGGYLAEMLSKKKNVLLLGNPGLGKTTTSLLSYRDISSTFRSDIPNIVSMYASWKDFSPLPSQSDEVIRAMIALPRNRPPWPGSLQLPNVKWVLVLDGFDEFQSDKAAAVKTLADLAIKSTVLVTCREYDFDRYLRLCKSSFNSIIKLVVWDARKIDLYVEALRRAKRSGAVTFIKRQLRDGNLPSFLSLPLWLTMLTYLAESRTGVNVQTMPLPENEYDLVRLCADRVAEEEIARYHADSESSQLRTLWSQTAWLLHRAVRERVPLRADVLTQQLRPEPQDRLKEAVFSCLEVRAGVVKGFFHEVFREYWLAEYIVDQISHSADDRTILELLGYQRSVVTNKFVRLRIQSRETVENISERLRRAFFVITDSSGSAVFAKNQILYVLGRIDTGPANRQFLSSIWNDEAEPPFVRYAAAWAEAMMGNKLIEQTYYSSLRETGVWDEINRGYHLYYYGDIDIDEEQVPPKDDHNSPAEATLRTLFRRLGRSQQEHLNLRRIELFTVRRFLETGRRMPPDVSSPKAIVKSAAKSVADHAFGQKFVQSVQREATRILDLLSRR